MIPPRPWFAAVLLLPCLASVAGSLQAAQSVAGTGSGEEFVWMAGYWVVSLGLTSLIEGIVLGRLFGMRFIPACRLGASVNLASSLAGIPFGILLGGSEHELIPLAVYWRWTTLGMFLFAITIESLVLRRLLRAPPARKILGGAVVANSVSFGLFLLFKVAL